MIYAVSLCVLAIGALAWYYHAQLVTLQETVNTQSDVLKANAATLASLNASLAKGAADATSANTADQAHAQNITTAPDAATYLNGAGGLPSASSHAGTGSAAKVRAAIRATGTCFVSGFVR